MKPFTGQNPQNHDHEEDLTSILTTEERVELTLLLANVTEVMRKQVEDIFKLPTTSAKKSQERQPLHKTNENSNLGVIGNHEETGEEKTKNIREKQEREFPAPRMSDLEKSVLNFFDTWRDSVILRVGQVMNNPKNLTEEQKKASVKASQPNSQPPATPKIISRFKLLF